METNENTGTMEKIKGFVSRNKKKVIITVSAIGATILGAGILGKFIGSDGSDYDYEVEEMEIEVEDTDQDDSNDE